MKTNTKATTRNLLPLAIASLAIAGISPATAASMVIKPTDAVAFSTYQTRVATNIHNASDSTIDTGEAIPASWATPTVNQDKTDSWLSLQLNPTTNPLASQWVVLDLGDTYSLDGMALWSYGAGSADWKRTIDDYTLSFATTLSDTFGSAASVANDFSSPVAKNAPDPLSVSFTSLSPITARYVLIDQMTQFTTNTSDYVGIGEIRFTGSAVPEPTTTALLGLGGLALILRRRK